MFLQVWGFRKLLRDFSKYKNDVEDVKDELFHTPVNVK